MKTTKQVRGQQRFAALFPLTLIWELDDVVIALNLSPVERSNQRLNGKQHRVPAEAGTKQRRCAVGATSNVDERSDENAFRVQRQCPNVLVELLPTITHEQILFDVGNIERRYRSVPFLQIFADATNSGRSAEIA